MSATAPVTCGQAIDVADFMPNKDGFFPTGSLPGSLLLGIMAAKMPVLAPSHPAGQQICPNVKEKLSALFSRCLCN